MKITYRPEHSSSLQREIIKAQYKGVIMELEEQKNLVFIYAMESFNKNQGECQEMIAHLREDFKGKELCSSPPVSQASKHILDKTGVNYKDYMK